MVNTCCVSGCKTGYKSHKNHPKIASFQFPLEEFLKNKWLKSIPQKNWTLSSSHRVCAKHFHESDLITKSTNKCHKRVICPITAVWHEFS